MVAVREVKNFLLATSYRSAEDRGITAEAVDMLDDLKERVENDEMPPYRDLEDAILNGAGDWKNYVESCCTLIYDEDIARRYLPPKAFEHSKLGSRPLPGGRTWMDIEAAMCYRAYMRISRILATLEARERRRVSCEK